MTSESKTMHADLREQLGRLGAVWPPAEEREATGPAHYGDSARELVGLRNGCGLSVGLSQTSLLDLRGSDRLRFLNGVCTLNTLDLEPGQGGYGYLTSVKGHVLSDLVVRAFEEVLRLELPPEMCEPVRDHLQKYVVVDDVDFAVAPDLVPMTLAGPESRTILTSVIGAGELPAHPWNHAAYEVLGARSWVAADPRRGALAWTLWVAPEIVQRLLEELVACGPSVVLVGSQASEVARIEAGIGHFGTDFGPENLPHEVAVEGAVDFDKGCYLGQEIVARLHFRGQASKRLFRVRFPAGVAALPGDSLVADGRAVGTITSSARRGATEKIVALAMLQRRAEEEATRIETPAGEAVEVLGPATAFV